MLGSTTLYKVTMRYHYFEIIRREKEFLISKGFAPGCSILRSKEKVLSPRSEI